MSAHPRSCHKPRRRSLAVSLASVALLVAAPLAAADGALDPKFNGTGGALVRVGSYDFARAVAVQPDGKVLLAGRAEVPNRR